MIEYDPLHPQGSFERLAAEVDAHLDRERDMEKRLESVENTVKGLALQMSEILLADNKHQVIVHELNPVNLVDVITALKMADIDL